MNSTKWGIFLWGTMHFFAHAYESGFSNGAAQWRPLRESCSNIIKKAALAAAIFGETHCKKTAEYIIGILIKKWDIQKQATFYCDMVDLLQNSVKSALFVNDTQRNHMIFLVNICGGGHVCIIEKKVIGSVLKWRIFQSWQDQFTLAQWCGVDWDNDLFEWDYRQAGAGTCAKTEYIVHFLKACIKVCGPRMQQFKACGIPLPYELEITEFTV